MIQLIVGSTSNDKRVINKTMSSQITVSAEIYGDVSILAPQLLIEYNSAIFNLNYIYIAAFNRYYFLTNVILSSGDRMILTCAIDPLNSFKTEILALNTTVVRQEQADDNFLPDSCMTPVSKKDIKVYQLDNNVLNLRGPDAHSSSNYVLCVAGGHTSNVSN